jgi:D-aminopeptidase
VPIVPAAILFDLLNGGAKDWDKNPYAALGAQALADAGLAFGLGTAGAGTGATTADLKGGLGSASVVLPDGTTVGALVAVNAVGSACLPGSRSFWAAPFEMDAEFGGLGTAPFDATLPPPLKTHQPGEATTIAIVATDAKLDKAGCTRLATAAHDGLARAIVPAHTPFDGDLVFGVSHGTRNSDPVLLCHAAALCLSRAVARGVYHATPATHDTRPCWSARA